MQKKAARDRAAFLYLRWSRLLLKCHQHLNHTSAFIQGLQRLPYDCSQHSAAIRTFHGVSGNGRCHKQIAGLNRSILSAHLAGHDTGSDSGWLHIEPSPGRWLTDERAGQWVLPEAYGRAGK